jgi:hypothetical protein
VALYVLAGIWNAIWLTGRVISENYHHIIWGILFLLIPPVFFTSQFGSRFVSVSISISTHLLFTGALG